MKSLRLSVTTLVLLGLICVINGNLITNLLGKSDDKAETDDKAAATAKPAEGAPAPAAPAPAAPAAAVPAAPAAAATTSPADPGSSCGGLKGFLHICDKSEPTEPPKNVKTRSVDDDDDDDDDDDSSSSSEENSHELKELRKKKKAEEKEDDDDDDKDEVDNQEGQSSTSEATSTTEGQKIKKRQADADDEEEEEEEPRTEKLDDYPFESPVFSMAKKRSVDAVKDEESKPMNATEVTADQQEKEEEVRRRRDCGDGGKDCRRKRELVPCLEPRCVRRQQEMENE